MKKATLLVITGLLISISFIRCRANYEDYRGTTKEIISQGKWSVDYYYEGQDKTSQYANAQFIFSGNGKVSCQQDTINYDGTWRTIKDVNRNDVLIIQLNSQNPKLMQLSQQWNVTGLSFNLVDMKDNNHKEWRIKQL